MQMPKPKIFACYERNFAKAWNLVCYHNSKPPKSVNSSDRDRTEYFDVPDSMIDDFQNPMFGEIAKTFPAPVH